MLFSACIFLPSSLVLHSNTYHCCRFWKYLQENVYFTSQDIADNNVFYGLLLQCSSEKWIHLNSNTNSLGLPIKVQNLLTVSSQVSAVHRDSSAVAVAANWVSRAYSLILEHFIQCFTRLQEILHNYVRLMCSVKLLKSYKSSLF